MINNILTIIFYNCSLDYIIFCNINQLYIQNLFFTIKILIFLCIFVLIRVSFPRFRYDQLMRLGWKVLLPLSFCYMFFVFGLLLIYG